MTPEGQVKAAIMEYLAVRHILAFRMQTGSMVGEYKGKTRLVSFGVPGMADILAFPRVEVEGYCGVKHDEINPLWIECKAPKKKQSEPQKSFQAQVEAQGHRYIIARSIDDVEAALK
jgi:hypothetical protein